MHTFEIDGTTFEITPLKLKQALKAESLLVEALFPAFASLASIGKFGSIDPQALAGLSRISELTDIFAAVCKVDWDKGAGSTARVPLAPFLDQVFSRRNAVHLAWLVACVEWQFSDFFDGTGGTLLTHAASRFESLLGSIGGSGDSLPTDGFQTD